MSGIFSIIIPLLLLAVAFILGLGLVNMMKGGSSNRSQNLMRMRVLVQFVAIIVMVAALYFVGKG